MKNFFKKLVEIYLRGLLINGQNQLMMHQALWDRPKVDQKH